MLWSVAPLDLKVQTNSVRDDKVSPSITVSGIPPGCTSLFSSQIRVWLLLVWSFGREWFIFTDADLAALGHENNMCNFWKAECSFHYIIDVLCSKMYCLSRLIKKYETMNTEEDIRRQYLWWYIDNSIIAVIAKILGKNYDYSFWKLMHMAEVVILSFY